MIAQQCFEAAEMNKWRLVDKEFTFLMGGGGHEEERVSPCSSKCRGQVRTTENPEEAYLALQ